MNKERIIKLKKQISMNKFYNAKGILITNKILNEIDKIFGDELKK